MNEKPTNKLVDEIKSTASLFAQYIGCLLEIFIVAFAVALIILLAQGEIHIPH